MLNKLIIDELNVLMDENFSDNADEVVDYVESLLILAYKMGREDTVGALSGMAMDLSIAKEKAGYEDDEDLIDYVIDMEIDIDKVREALFKPIAGKTFEQRIREYTEEGDVPSVKRVVETEFHRMFETASNTAAEEAENKTGRSVKKTWFTMLDDKVRDTHDYLEGMSVPREDKFFTFDGDSAMFPGDFENAENNVNCRCTVMYSWS